ncbi:MAG: hypothetical protein NTU87_02555 [Verrucomicrobia bacterium]|nr:hypothetical protein [Verrucomicrobiota bacterium]
MSLFASRGVLLLMVIWPLSGMGEDEVSTVWNEFNQNGVVMIEPSPGLETPASKEARLEREKEMAKDAKLNRSLVRQEIYWLEGRWVKKGEALEAPRSLGELIDSDHDGFDDFTEIKFHCDPTNPDSNPSHYFEVKGSNRVIFFSTNTAASSR